MRRNTEARGNSLATYSTYQLVELSEKFSMLYTVASMNRQQLLLFILGETAQDAVQKGLDLFHEHLEDLHAEFPELVGIATTSATESKPKKPKKTTK
jgi:dihydroorotase